MSTTVVSQVTKERAPLTSTLTILVVLLLDILLGIRPVTSLGLTIVQALLILPWALQVFRLEPSERERPSRERVRIVALHLLTLGLVVLCLVEKGIVLSHTSRFGAASYLVSYRTYSVGVSVFFLIGLFARGSRLGRFFGSVAEHPARLMAISFGLASTLGGFVLTLPQSLVRINDASFVDGLFTATSAVCVTGLTVNHLASTYTLFGQAVILLLVQIGGLGIMVLSSFFALVAGTRMRVRSSAALAEMIDADSLASIKRNVIAIVLYTFAIELVGALLFGLSVLPHEALARHAPRPLGEEGGFVWIVVFHTVSAFCNAGFSLFDGGLTGIATSWPPCTVLATLIVLGGLGFPVIDELGRRLVTRLRKRRPKRLSLHTRVVLATSLGLTALAMLAFLLFEWGGAMKHLPYHARVLAAFFQSVSLRSGGYNTIDFGLVHPATLTIACLVMFVGGSPGGTAGGIKTTTFATLLATFRAEIRAERRPRLFDRVPPEGVVRRALGVAFLSTTLCAFFVITLFLVQPGEPLALAFEALSAFATTGLSTGITTELHAPAKLLLVVAMFVGRIGPMTFALAMVARDRRLPYELPEERLAIG